MCAYESGVASPTVESTSTRAVVTCALQLLLVQVRCGRCHSLLHLLTGRDPCRSTRVRTFPTGGLVLVCRQRRCSRSSEREPKTGAVHGLSASQIVSVCVCVSPCLPVVHVTHTPLLPCLPVGCGCAREPSVQPRSHRGTWHGARDPVWPVNSAGVCRHFHVMHLLLESVCADAACVCDSLFVCVDGVRLCLACGTATVGS